MCCEAPLRLCVKIEGGPFRKLRIFSQSQECRKTWKGRPFGLFQTSVCCKISKKLEGGTLWRQKKFEKKSHSAEKNSKGDPIVSSGFVSYDKNGVTERGTLCTILNALPVRLPVQ